MVDGGTTACSYLLRVEIAQSLNADAVVVAHNATGNAPVLAGLSIDEPVVICAVAVNQADGTAIKALSSPPGRAGATSPSTRTTRASATATSRTGSSSTSMAMASRTA